MSSVEHTLAALLHRERRAIATLDLGALEVIAAEKMQLIETLRNRDPAPAAADVREILREAEANRALITDALEAIKSALGLSDRTGTYDGRARVRPAAHVSAARSSCA
jgi:hypothetical protein